MTPTMVEFWVILAKYSAELALGRLRRVTR